MDGIVRSDQPAAVMCRRGLARALHGDLAALRDDLLARSDARMAQWEPAIRRDAFRPSARNLADWLALRETDLTPLQGPLARLGLSTLGRLDGHVRPSLAAVLAALADIGGEPSDEVPPAAEGESLAERRDALFGARSEGPSTRIMVTLPAEAAGDPRLVRSLVAEGADVFRINCAHDGPQEWAAMVAHIREASRASDRHVPISMDLGGPKFRIAELSTERKTRLFPGDRLAFAASTSAGPKHLIRATLSHPALLEALTEDAEVTIDDGRLRAVVVGLARDHAALEVRHAPTKGFKIKPGKGVNLPGRNLRVEALTPADHAALDFVVPHADLVAFSFVQTPADVQALVAALRERAVPGRPLPAILLKIETPLALRNLPELIVAAGAELPVGVMIARGDLAVEIGFERLSEIQEEILWLCEAAQVPVVWATQVLEGMAKEGQASRAEVTDAAMSQRADCVMLNKGPFILPTVAFLRGILLRMDRHHAKKSDRLGPLHLWAR
ncbi:pyruvate kinase [Rhodobacter sp. CZR27]|uniref:pyruvate kinase n=1 Tax=Rhodobacter sp. CZR27 TaxID=2033869 RepID=UPI000BBE305F|nr:pyruvate kinase [Rhodobacter sp. CZR27]